MGVILWVIKQKSADGIVAKCPSQWLGQGEGGWPPRLNLNIIEEPVQLNCAVSDRT